MIEIDIPHRSINMIGINDIKISELEISKVLEQRKIKWIAPENKLKKGVMDIYTQYAVSHIKDGYMENK